MWAQGIPRPSRVAEEVRRSCKMTIRNIFIIMTLGCLSKGRTLSFAKALNLFNLIKGSPQPGCLRDKISWTLYRWETSEVGVLQPCKAPREELE